MLKLEQLGWIIASMRFPAEAFADWFAIDF